MVACKPGQRVSEADLVAHCKALIAGYKCPKQVVFLDELPRTGTGKVSKLALRELARQGAQ